jgi:hypothetical protein
MRKKLLVASVVLLVASILGIAGSFMANAMVFDKYDAYGEVPIPGTRTLHLPAGDVKVSFHTEIAGTMEGGGLPIPQNLAVTITPVGGSAQPTFTQSPGDTDADNQDVRVKVGVAHLPAAGDYTVKADGKSNAYISPRLSFGHDSDYGFLPWLFGGLAGVSLLTMLAVAVSARPQKPEHAVPEHVSEISGDEDASAARLRRNVLMGLLLIGLASLGVIAAKIGGVGIPFAINVVAIVLLVSVVLLLALRYWIRHTYTPEELTAKQAEIRANKVQISSAKESIKYKREVAHAGTEGRAVITGITDLGYGDETRWLVQLELEVTVGVRPPYPVSTGEYVGIASAGSVAVGRELVVRVDHADPQRVAVDWEQSLRLRQTREESK